MSEIKQKFEAGLDTIKTLTGVSQTDFDTLRQAAPQAYAWVDEIVKIFYDTAFGHQRTAAVFHTGERPAREVVLHRHRRGEGHHQRDRGKGRRVVEGQAAQQGRVHDVA